METTLIIKIVFYLALLDVIFANIIAWSNLKEKYYKKFPGVARYLPLAKGSTFYYLVLMIVIGYLLHNFVTPLF